MKELLLTTLILTAGMNLCAQSHETGDFNINVDYALGLALSESGSIDDVDIEDEIFDDQDLSSGGLRLDVQYGLSDAFSIGVLGRISTYTTKYNNQQPGFELDDVDRASTEVGLEFRFYPVNLDGVNVFIAPSFGIAGTVEKNLDDGEDEENYKYGGIFYGAGIGANVFFHENIGANLMIGYGGRSYNNDVDTTGDGVTVEVTDAISGIDLALGLSLRF